MHRCCQAPVRARARTGSRFSPFAPRLAGALLLGLSLALAGTARARAQEPGHEGMDMPGARPWALSAQGILALTTVSPAHSGLRYTEGYLTQPVVMAHARLPGGWLRALGTLDLEGLTLRRGELTPGAWGEGYVDRRHPHTYVHELVASAVLERGALGASLSAGKGFAPFGTDDPMVRPFLKYPSNHHLSQVLERAVGIAAVRAGPVTLEGGLFNGDEPRRPSDFADLGRFGDSWAARATVRAAPGLELQASRAFVRSPERPDRHGLDQRKWSASARYGGDARASRYALVEWATTRERAPGAPPTRYSTVLAEGALPAGPLLLAARYERSTRPEEERLANPFRSPRPTPDFSLIGITRFESVTLHARWPAGVRLGGSVRVTPFVEGMLTRPGDTRPSPLFRAADFYGARNIGTVSAGLKIGVGEGHGRMGRYGIVGG